MCVCFCVCVCVCSLAFIISDLTSGELEGSQGKTSNEPPSVIGGECLPKEQPRCGVLVRAACQGKVWVFFGKAELPH